jgi:hypothetical protein
MYVDAYNEEPDLVASFPQGNVYFNDILRKKTYTKQFKPHKEHIYEQTYDMGNTSRGHVATQDLSMTQKLRMNERVTECF